MPAEVTSKFRLGRLVSTPNAINSVPSDEVLIAINRHRTGDWGDCVDEDKKANDQALIDGSRVLSVYHTKGGVKFWIITEADRSATTVLLRCGIQFQPVGRFCR